jgi:hypothetical protein
MTKSEAREGMTVRHEYRSGVSLGVGTIIDTAGVKASGVVRVQFESGRTVPCFVGDLEISA